MKTYSRLSVLAMAAACSWAVPAQAKSQAGTVTLTAEQWQAIQNELAQLHQDVDQLKASQQTTQQQAAQAQAAATQAQTTATVASDTAKAATDSAKAATVTAQAASDKGGAFADAAKWAADTKVSGRMYFNVSTISADDAAGNKVEKDGGFNLSRFYVGIDHKFSSVLSGNITTDVTAASGSGAQLYVKKAYLDAKFSKALDVRLGATDMPWIPYVEGIYGYRHIEKTLTDLDGFGTSSDWGLHVMGSLADGLISYQVSAVNGAGYKTIKKSKAVDLEGRVSLSYKGFNAAIGGYTGKLGKDDGTSTIYHTANRFNAMLAYKGDIAKVPFTVGGEYFYAKNWKQVAAIADDASDGYSIFASVAPVKQWSVFSRYDWIKPSKDLNPLQSDRYFNIGVQYSPAKIVDLALTYKHDSADGGLKIGNLGSGQATRDEIGLYGQFRW